MMVTGASSGIGKDIAIEAAKAKYDLILTARREDKLKEIKEEIESNHGVRVEILTGDLTKAEDISKIVSRIEQNDIDVLVNNAGFGSSGPFIELDIDNELNEIDLNVRALVQLSHAGAKSFADRKSGSIVNISSVASYQPMVGNATYGASKAFVTSFTHALSEELSSYGVDVLLVCPGPTDTEFFVRSSWFEASKGGNGMPKFLWQDSDKVAKLVVKSIQKRRSVLIPGLSNKLLASLSSSLPGTLTKKITALIAKGRRTR